MMDSVTVKLGKADVLNLICGSQNMGLAASILAQPQEWDRDALAQMSVNELMTIYAQLNWAPVKPEVEAKALIVPLSCNVMD